MSFRSCLLSRVILLSSPNCINVHLSPVVNKPLVLTNDKLTSLVISFVLSFILLFVLSFVHACDY